MNQIASFMIAKDDGHYYRTAFEYSLQAFSSRDPAEIAESAGAEFDYEHGIITLSSFGRRITVSYPQGEVRFAGTSLMPVWEWRLIILNYLGRADNTPLTGKLITYKETEHGQVFYPAFYRSYLLPLIKRLSAEEPAKVKAACCDLGAVVAKRNDISAVFSVLPRFPVTVRIWPGDEELPGSANILFDSSANHYLHTEDIAAVGGLVARFLIRQFEINHHNLD